MASAAGHQVVFVYGSLRRGGRAHVELARTGARFLGPAALRGRLYDLGEYPGLVVSEDGDRVVGELWAVDAAGLAALDRFEGAGDAAGHERLFVRAEVEVSTPAGPLRAQAWLWPGPTDPLARIASGDWLEARRGDP